MHTSLATIAAMMILIMIFMMRMMFCYKKKVFLCTTAAFPLSLSDHLWHAITANDGDDDCVGDDDDNNIDE